MLEKIFYVMFVSILHKVISKNAGNRRAQSYVYQHDNSVLHLHILLVYCILETEWKLWNAL